MKGWWITFVSAFLLIHQVKAQVEPLLLYEAKQEPACKAWVDKTMDQRKGRAIIYLHDCASKYETESFVTARCCPYA